LAVFVTVSDSQFFIENTHFFYLFPSFNLKFENVSFKIDRWTLACPSFTRMANYFCKKIFFTIYLLARVHSRRADEQTDGRQPCQ